MNHFVKAKLVLFTCILSFILLIGCVSLQEVGKKLWGSSTEALEKARPQGKSQTFECSLSNCFDEGLKIIDSLEATVFKKDKRAGYIVAMNFQVKDVIDTTELGIFFTNNENSTKVEITSLNPGLVEAVAPEFFSRLKEKFPVVN